MDVKRRIVSAVVFLVVAFWNAGCAARLPAAAPAAATQSPAAPTIASPNGLSPAETVDEFYKWHLSYIGKGNGSVRNPLVDGAYRETGYLTDRFAQQVAAAAGGSQGGFDPFLCAQDVPTQVLPSKVGEEGQRSVVEVHTSFEGQRFLVYLVHNGAAWQIDDIRCGGDPEPENTPAPAVATVVVTPQPSPQPIAAAVVQEGWQIYRNEQFRFQVGYPQGWVVREVAAMEGEPPIGPENMKLVVMLMPQTWAEQLDGGGAPDPNAPLLVPFTVEVTLGADDVFWGSYGPQTDQAQVKLAHAEALSTVEEVTEEISIHRYVYQHPISADLRVVLTDPISGFPDRRTAYAEIAGVFDMVANSFAWLD